MCDTAALHAQSRGFDVQAEARSFGRVLSVALEWGLWRFGAENGVEVGRAGRRRRRLAREQFWKPASTSEPRRWAAGQAARATLRAYSRR